MHACSKRLAVAVPFFLFASTLLVGPLAAQSAQRWSAQGSLIYVGTFGDAYEGMSGGPGGELQIRFTPGRLSLGIGGQTSSHSVDLEEFGKQDATLAGGFIEPRFVFDVGSDRFAPYGAARLAYLKQSLTLEGLEASASGTQLNIGGGVLVRMSPRINLDLGATFGAINFDDVKLSYQGESITVPGTSGSGQNLVLRAGLAIGLR
jgi:hypothetical protein